MRLRLGEILKENGRQGLEPSTVDQLAKKSKGRLSVATAVRLARDEWKVLPRDVLITLCEVLEVGPDDLLDYSPRKRKRGQS
jgi:DNA-binding Xre family transcriptional regulator